MPTATRSSGDTRKVQLLGNAREREAWRACADRAGIPPGAWMRRALNEQAALEHALLREERKHAGA